MGTNVQSSLTLLGLLGSLLACTPKIEGELIPFYLDGVLLSEHRVFITSTTSNANFGGLSGADARCATLAADAGLSGTYKAMLSSESVHLRDRIQITGAIYNFSSIAQSTRVASSNPITSTDLDFGIFYDEKYASHALGAAIIATGSFSDGTAATNLTCQSWTSNSGGISATVSVSGQTTNFLTNTATTCDTSMMRIYCISQ